MQKHEKDIKIIFCRSWNVKQQTYLRIIEMNTRWKKSNSSQMYVSEIIAMHEAKHRQNTQGVNHALLHHLVSFSGRPPQLADITEEYCYSFAEFLMNRVTVGSVKTYLQKMHAVLEHAVSAHLIPSNPMPSIRTMIPTAKRSRRVFLVHDEIAKLTNTPCCHEETKRAFLFACQTGLRLSDIETLAWDDIYDINGKPTIVKVQKKTGREVSVPLNAVAMKLLGPPNTAKRVFSLKSRSVIATDLIKWAMAAGIKKHLTFHVSRHTFATLSISAGVDIYVVSRLCGHATVRTTEIYAHIIDKTLQQGVALLEKAMMNNHEIPEAKKRMSIKDRIKKTFFPLFLWRFINKPHINNNSNYQRFTQ